MRTIFEVREEIYQSLTPPPVPQLSMEKSSDFPALSTTDLKTASAAGLLQMFPAFQSIRLQAKLIFFLHDALDWHSLIAEMKCKFCHQHDAILLPFPWDLSADVSYLALSPRHTNKTLVLPSAFAITVALACNHRYIYQIMLTNFKIYWQYSSPTCFCSVHF